jgi:hypothetical protein
MGCQVLDQQKNSILWSPVESMWSYGVHMESMGECKVHPGSVKGI